MNRKITLLFAILLCITSLNAQTNFEIAIEALQATDKYTSNDLSDLLITDEYQSKHNLVTHLYLQQRYQGISVNGAHTNFNIKSGLLTSSGGSFVENLQSKINSTSNSLSATQALQKVMTLHELNGSIPAIHQIENTADKKTTFEKGDIAS